MHSDFISKMMTTKVSGFLSIRRRLSNSPVYQYTNWVLNSCCYSVDLKNIWSLWTFSKNFTFIRILSMLDHLFACVLVSLTAPIVYVVLVRFSNNKKKRYQKSHFLNNESRQAQKFDLTLLFDQRSSELEFDFNCYLWRWTVCFIFVDLGLRLVIHF